MGILKSLADKASTESFESDVVCVLQPYHYVNVNQSLLMLTWQKWQNYFKVHESIKQ